MSSRRKVGGIHLNVHILNLICKMEKSFNNLMHHFCTVEKEIYKQHGKHGIISGTRCVILSAGGGFMVTVYCYDRCSTCKKALAWLEKNGIAFEVLDIKTRHPDAGTLRALYKKSGLPLRRFFNTSGMLYREKRLAEKLPDMTEEEMTDLLASDGMLVKRPLLVTDRGVFPGFREAEWKTLLGIN